MRRYILSILSLVLFLAATLVSVYFIVALAALPENPTDMSASIGKGLSVAISILFFAAAAAVQAVAAILALIGLIVAKKTAADRRIVWLYAIQTVLPILTAILPFLFLPS